jgi:hypothetical protein
MSGKPERSEVLESVSLGLGWSATLEERSRGAVLRVQHPEQQPLTLEITIGANGPVIRAAAAALELEAATDIVARCERFAVEASGSASITAGTIAQRASGPLRMEASEVAVDARTGSVVVSANDDVQLLGEEILLNCDRDVSLPSWIPVPASEATLAHEDVAGDPDLLAKE